VDGARVLGLVERVPHQDVVLHGRVQHPRLTKRRSHAPPHLWQTERAPLSRNTCGCPSRMRSAPTPVMRRVYLLRINGFGMMAKEKGMYPVRPSTTEAGSYLRLIDSCITQLTAQGPSGTCNESKEEDEEAHLLGDVSHAALDDAGGARRAPLLPLA